jgi:hypothetical protein
MTDPAVIQSVNTVLLAIAELAQLRRAFRDSLRSEENVVTITEGLDFRIYDSGPVMECYVDAELKSGLAVGWWLEVTWSMSEFTLLSSVAVNDENGQDVITQWDCASERPDDVFGHVVDYWRRATEIGIEEAMRRYQIQRG